MFRDAVVKGVKDIEEKYGPNTPNWKWEMLIPNAQTLVIKIFTFRKLVFFKCWTFSFRLI